MANRPVPMSTQEFVECGLLGLINALVLWPRGVALGYEEVDGHVPEGTALTAYKVEPPQTIGDLDEDGTLAKRLQALMKWDAQRGIAIESWKYNVVIGKPDDEDEVPGA